MCVTNTVNRRPQALTFGSNLSASGSFFPNRQCKAVFAVNDTSDICASATAENASVTSSDVSDSSRYEPDDLRPRRRRKPQQPGKTAKLNDRHFVVHNYHDHALDDEDFVEDVVEAADSNDKRRGGVATSFPQKLHEMLDRIEADGLAGVISWQPHGRAFLVHKPKEFVSVVMPKYFRQTKLTSFQRQLNLYGFCRLTRGKDSRGYYHELFLRGKPSLTNYMVRTKVKGTGFKAASSPDQEPDLYSFPPVEVVTPPVSCHEASDGSTSVDVSSTGDIQSEPCQLWNPTQHPPCTIEAYMNNAGAFAEPHPIPMSPPMTPIHELFDSSSQSICPDIQMSNSFDIGLENVVEETMSWGQSNIMLEFAQAWCNADVDEQEIDDAVESDMQLGFLLEQFLGDNE